MKPSQAVWRWACCLMVAVALHAVLAWRLLSERAEPMQNTTPPATVLLDMSPAPTAPPKPAVPAITPVQPPPARMGLAPARRPATPQIRPHVIPKPLVLPHLAPRFSEPGPGPSQAQAPAPTPSAAAAPTAVDDAIANWKASLLSRLRAVRRYPEAAREKGETGTAIVRFTMDRIGRVLTVELIRSSGSEALDEEAVAMVHRAAPLPPPPTSVTDEMPTLTVPVRFE